MLRPGRRRRDNNKTNLRIPIWIVLALLGFNLLEAGDDSNKDPGRKEKIREAQAKLEATLPLWAKRDWRWEEIVSACQFKVRN